VQAVDFDHRGSRNVERIAHFSSSFAWSSVSRFSHEPSGPGSKPSHLMTGSVGYRA
jgi:hypothetical protein